MDITFIENTVYENTNMFFEFALNNILEEYDFQMVDVSDLPYIEIDLPEDLEEASNYVMP